MQALELIRLTPLLERSKGKAEIVIGLIDGPVSIEHPAFRGSVLRAISGTGTGTCGQAESFACKHGTLVAGVLSAQRESEAPAICPGCTLLVRPIFTEGTEDNRLLPSATPGDLATAILDCIQAGAHVINMSLALAQPTAKGEHELEAALDQAAQRGVIIVAAAGNQGMIGSSSITRHRWTIPVIACDLQGRPSALTNLSNSIGRWGLAAPGEEIVSLGAGGGSSTFSGTSAATPFVTGTIALLRSEFPAATAAQVKLAVTQTITRKRTSVIPPLLNAWTAYQALQSAMRR